MSIWSVLGGVGGFLLGGPAGAAIGSGLGGALDSKNSTNQAVKAQADATASSNATALQAQREAQAYAEKIDARNYADQAPYRLAGTNALAKLSGAADFTGADLANEPGYQFGLAEGNRGLTNSAAARGGLLSGAALKASTKYAQDYAGTKYNDAFNRDATNKNRLATLAGIGQTSNGQSASSGLQTSSQVGNGILSAGQTVGNNALGLGNARASGYLANGNALTTGINGALSAWNSYNSPSSSTGTNSLANWNFTPTPLSTALPNLYD